MPLGRPRRIFRASSLSASRPPRGRLAAGLAVLGVVGLAAWGLPRVHLPSISLFSAASVPPAAPVHVAADPAQIAVLDGDTLRVHDTVVRLLGIAAPPRGERCRAADGAGFDCGAAATNALANLVRARPVDCRIAGADRMGHPLGVCEASGRQINRALVAAGYARAEAPVRDATGLHDIGLQVVDLRSDETEARAQRRGLWAGGTDTSW